MWIIKIIKIKCFYPPRILDELGEHWCIYSCLQIPPKNWFQYVRRVYTTAINFPCISTLVFAIQVNPLKSRHLNWPVHDGLMTPIAADENWDWQLSIMYFELFNTTTLIQNLIYIRFGKILTQFLSISRDRNSI